MEGSLSTYDVEDSKVPQNNCQVDGAKGKRDPAMEIFQTLEACQEESGFLEAAVVNDGHDITILDSQPEIQNEIQESDRIESSVT
jgi:hypothetical protein